MDQILAIITALQTQLDALKAIQTSAPQFSQADLDAATAAGNAAGVAQANAGVAADLASLKGADDAAIDAVAAKYAPPAPVTPSA